MPIFRKKPVEIEAIQFTGDNLSDCILFLGDDFGGKRQERYKDMQFMIRTLEGEHIASKGDWIIRGVKGEHYPCKPDIFEATYDAV